MRRESSLEIHLPKLKKNFELIKQRTNAEIIFMVKANAYGHGLKEIVEYTLNQNLCSDFGCATIDEALFLKKNIKIPFKAWVFSDSQLHNSELAQKYSESILPVIHNIQDLKYWLNLSDVPLVLKLNTGMNRLGFREDEIDEVIQMLKQKKIEKIYHLMSHFSTSYLPLKKGNRAYQQKESFDRSLKKIKDNGFEIQGTSFANSGAIEQDFALEYSHIRPGLMLYGPTSLPIEQSTWKGEIISHLKTKIIELFEVKKGTPIGYGGHVCHQDGVVAIIPLGYGDGLLTSYSGVKFKSHNFEALFLGRINMDLAQIYFPIQSKGRINLGSEVIVWSSKQEEMASLCSQMKTIPYQLFCALTQRLPRKYLS